VGNGKVGTITQRLQEAFFAIVEGLTGDSHGWLFPIDAKSKVQRAARKAR
jgi:hypothetical protein